MFLNLLAAVNKDALMASLQIMWQGMLGIMVVLVVIALLVALLAKVTSRKPKDENKEN